MSIPHSTGPRSTGPRSTAGPRAGFGLNAIDFDVSIARSARSRGILRHYRIQNQWDRSPLARGAGGPGVLWCRGENSPNGTKQQRRNGGGLQGGRRQGGGVGRRSEGRSEWEGREDNAGYDPG